MSVRYSALLAALLCLVILCVSTQAQTPVPGQNINMVSGITLPTGDPFLQRQNEPSMAVSTRNPLHLLAGANDYRTVNLNTDTTPGQSVAADAWLGVFKSFDGGATWISTLLPGYPGDSSSAGLASPLSGLTTGSDPTVRSAPAGLFYYSSIAFNRSTNLGVVAVSRFIDVSLESGDSIRFLNTTVVDSGTSGQFLDKPWIAVGLPTGGTCTIQVPQGTGTISQTVPAAPVYLLWSRFTGSNSTKIMFSRSLDCGASWGTPTKLSESNSINQGTTIAVGPTGSNIYVAWRRFATSSQPGAIVVASSTNAGKTWGKAVDVVDLVPYNPSTPNATSFFDQSGSSTTFRTNAFPTVAVDGGGRVYVAWSQRGAPGVRNGEARIAMSTSSDGVRWSTPFFVDNDALDDRGVNVLDTSGNPLISGHQFMPQLTFTGGLLTLAYYDQREDHTVDLFTPNNPWGAGANGLFYSEAMDPRGDPASAVFTPFLSESGLTLRRHTIDVVVAQATPPATAGSQPAFVTARVSQYKYGLANDGTDIPGKLQQRQFNPPNLPLFAQGTTAFIGDYIDVAGLSFSPPSGALGWRFNTAERSPVHYVTWSDNRDVRPPTDDNGNYDGRWDVFTPPGSPNCDPGHIGNRNQNVYVSRVTQGLVLSSPQNTKPLSTILQREFTVDVQNFTNQDRTFRLTIANQPAGGYASFLPGLNNPGPPPAPPTPPSPVTTTLDLQVAAHSAASRPVFAVSSSATATITINAAEITGLNGSLVDGGLTAFVVLNPDPSAVALAALTMGNVETYDPSLSDPVFDTSADIINGGLANGGLANGALSFTDLSNGGLTNGGLTNGGLTNGGLANGGLTNGGLANFSLTNGGLTNGGLANGGLANGGLANGGLANTAISDATYTVTNNGTTTVSYSVNLAGTNATAPDQFLQVIGSKTYYTPFGLDCSGTLLQPQSIVLASVDVPLVQPISGGLTNGGLTNGGLANMTLAIPPGESRQITIRGLGITTTELQQIVHEQLVPVVVAHAANTDDPTNTPKFAAPLFITTVATGLPDGTVNTPYTATTLQVFGGKAPVTWSASPDLPTGLSLDPATGTISGTPGAAGTFNFTVQVSDSSSTPKTAQKALTITIAQATTTTAITSSSAPTLVGQPITVSWSVTINPPAGSSPATPSGTVTVSDGQGGSCTSPVTAGSCTLAPGASSSSTFILTATYSGDSNFAGSSGTQPHTVAFYTFNGFLSPLATAGTLALPTFSGVSNLGSAVPLKWQLSDLNGEPITSVTSLTSMASVFTGANCPPAAPVPEMTPANTVTLYSPTAGATGGSTFRYDTGGNIFIFNWDSSTALPTGSGCYAVVLQLSDRSPVKVAEVQLK